jgi:limonene-1,2-epoxide hydrolase
LRLLVTIASAAVAVAAGCGGDPPSPESVVRAWSNALNSGDNEAAARLFAPGAQVVQAGRRLRLATRADAVAFNASLPCSGQIVTLDASGETVTATFLLAHREASRCDGPGAEVTATFRVRDGRIVLWRQLPVGQSPPGDTV